MSCIIIANTRGGKDLSISAPTQINTRLTNFDNLKALLIFLVIFGHLIEPLIYDNAWIKLIYVFIYSFHIPAFIYITGRFSKPKIKKTLYLLFLYLIFQFAYTPFLHYFWKKDITLNFTTPHWLLWYLFSIVLYSSLSFILPKKPSQKTKTLLFVSSLLFAVAIGFIPFVESEFALSRTFSFLPFFVAGKYSLLGKVRSGQAWVYGLLSFLLTFIYAILSHNNQIALYQKYGYTHQASTWYWRLFIILIAFCWIRFLMSVSPNKKIFLISNIGKHTLFIYLIHGFVVKLLIYYLFPYFSTLLCFIFSIIILLGLFGLSCWRERVTEKIKIFKN